MSDGNGTSENLVPRFDGTITDLIGGGLYHNQQTGFGMPWKDGAFHTQIGTGDRLSELELRRLHRYDWLAGRIIDVPASDMTRAGFNLTVRDGSTDDIDTVMEAYKRLKGKRAFKQAHKWASLFGGSAIVVKTNGDDELDKPIIPERLKSIDRLVVLDRYQIAPDPAEWNPLEPEFYRLIRDIDLYSAKNEQMRYGKRIHHSRVMRFDGVDLPATDRRYNEGWGDSKLQRVGEVLKRYRTVGGTILSALQSFSILGVEMKGLSGLIATGKIPEIKSYLQEVSRSLSLYGVLLTDAEKASTEFKGRSLGGVEALFDKVFKDELTACTGLPAIKIWGEIGKAGLTDDGGAESRHYSDNIRAEQEERFYDHDRALLSWIMHVELGREPDTWDFEYNSLYNLSEKEQSVIRKTEADTYAVLINAGIISTDEARKAVGSDQSLESAIELEGEPGVAGLLPSGEDNSEEDVLEGELEEGDRTDAIRTDDSTPIKRILKWKGWEVGVQYFQFDRRHNKVLPVAYGHLRKSKGEDGMCVDVYIGGNLNSDRVFEIAQVIDGKFDEYKFVIGMDDIQSALKTYLQVMPASFMGGIREVSLNDLDKYRVSYTTKADNTETKNDAAIATTGEVLSEEEFDRLGEIDILALLENVVSGS